MSLRASRLRKVREKTCIAGLPYLKRAACFGVSSEYSIMPVRPLSSNDTAPIFSVGELLRQSFSDSSAPQSA